MNAIRTNLKIERNQLIKGILTWVPAIQNGYMAAACILHEIDRTVFKKTKEEKDLLLTLKERNKAERRKEFGTNYKRYLNSSANSVTFHNITMRNTTEAGEKIVLPLHMVKAFEKSLTEFNRNGFHYELTEKIYKESKLHFILDATLQEAINLGIKIGYNLKAEENEQGKTNH
jgi:hypothetical protein